MLAWYTFYALIYQKAAQLNNVSECDTWNPFMVDFICVRVMNLLSRVLLNIYNNKQCDVFCWVTYIWWSIYIYNYVMRNWWAILDTIVSMVPNIGIKHPEYGNPYSNSFASLHGGTLALQLILITPSPVVRIAICLPAASPAPRWCCRHGSTRRQAMWLGEDGGELAE
jgi:hypothetical protein